MNKLNHELPVTMDMSLESPYFFLSFDTFVVHGNSVLTIKFSKSHFL